MRILQIHNRYREYGGEDTVVASEADLLRRAGHEVMQHQVQNPPGRLEASGALTLAAWNPVSAHRIRSLAKQLRPDVAHIHNTWFQLSPSVLRALHQACTPVVMTLHNYRLLCANGILFREGEPCELCVGSSPWPGLRHRCYRGSAAASAAAAAAIATNQVLGSWKRHVDSFLALTEFGKSIFVRGGLPEDRLTVKPNSVADPGPREKAPSASKTVLYVGRLSEDKGVLRLIDAWRDAATEGLELLLIGDGPLRREIDSLLSAGVRATGRLAPAEVRALMCSSRCLAFPSPWYEGQPMVILEALAAGLPVLASNRGGTAETLQGLAPNWLVEPYDRVHWQEGLARLTDDAVVDQIGRQSRAMYESRFTPEHSLRGLEAAYGRAMDRFASR